MNDLSKKPVLRAEVDKLLHDIRQEYEKRLREQKERIFMLLGELESTKKENERLKRRDGIISKALISAVEKVKKVEEIVQKERESERQSQSLIEFTRRCERYLANMLLNYPLDNNLKKFKHFTEVLKENFVSDGIIDELAVSEDSAHTAFDSDFNPKSKIENYIKSESGFNMDDVLYPKGELDLEKLCRELGLMD